MKSAGAAVGHTGKPRIENSYSIEKTKRKGAEAPFLKPNCLVLRSRRAEDTQRVRHAERITLAGLVAHVAGVEVAVHAVSQRGANEVLQTIRNIGGQEPSFFGFAAISNERSSVQAAI
jgi:hypothetical protein